MVDRKVMAFALATVMVVGVFGPHAATMIQTAEGHGVQAQLQSRFIRIEDETFNRHAKKLGGRPTYYQYSCYGLRGSRRRR
jgi:methane/ammonia monooxygenase subunit B